MPSVAVFPLSGKCELRLSSGLRPQEQNYRADSPPVLPYKTHNITWRLGVNVTHPTHFTSEWEVQVEVSCDKVWMSGTYDLQQNKLSRGI